MSRDKGDVISVATPEKTELRGMQNGNSTIGNKDLAEDPQKRELSKQILLERNGINNRTKIVPEVQFQVEGSLKPLNSVQMTETYVQRDNKGKVVPKGYQYKYRDQVVTKRIAEPQELNSAGTSRAMAMAGAAAVPEEFNKWFPLVADLYLGTSKQRTTKREALENKVFRQENIPVPLRPEQLPRFHRELNLTFGKEKASEMMKFVEEASYAYWNKTK